MWFPALHNLTFIGENKCCYETQIMHHSGADGQLLTRVTGESHPVSFTALLQKSVFNKRGKQILVNIKRGLEFYEV